MKFKRRTVVITLIFATAAYVGVYQNCSGTHERSADFSISTSQVETYIQDVECAASGATNTDSVNAITNLSALEQTSGSELFYGEAPSSMGSVDLVAPLNYSALRTDGGGTPYQIYAFFVLAQSGAASLVIGVADSTTAATPATTSTSTVAQVQAKMKKLVFSKNHTLDSTSGSSTCSSSNPLGLTTAIAAQNDGTMGLEMPTWGDGSFEMQLELDASNQLVIRSYDVDNGDLQSTIQLEVNQIDPNSGEEIYLGDINLTQPD